MDTSPANPHNKKWRSGKSMWVCLYQMCALNILIMSVAQRLKQAIFEYDTSRAVRNQIPEITKSKKSTIPLGS